ncbi:hypothetical protein [Priestia endophytica]|uniref:hypothetical protein n=1 Tax=Priestia endophytica TaxID=135735 RepID=UPI00227DC0C4|nr:hypothetical protein [Priestia endophytica]MCY8235272.1 hypothetical protein [Priestia endophytica]
MERFCDKNFFQISPESPFFDEYVIKLMDPKIKKVLNNVSARNREDIEQDLKLKIIESINNVKIDQTPGFWEFKKKIESHPY